MDRRDESLIWPLYRRDGSIAAKVTSPDLIPDVIVYGGVIYYYSSRNGQFEEADVLYAQHLSQPTDEWEPWPCCDEDEPTELGCMGEDDPDDWLSEADESAPEQWDWDVAA